MYLCAEGALHFREFHLRQGEVSGVSDLAAVLDLAVGEDKGQLTAHSGGGGCFFDWRE